MKKPIILVTGSSGQLGNEISRRAISYPEFEFVFTDRANLPLNDPQLIEEFVTGLKPQFILNCAAYTAVDKAETDKENAYQVNATAVGQLALLASQLGAKFLHVSTDYVFDGTSPVPYRETDQTAPVNHYGYTKLQGERLCFENNKDAIVVRTSWVYSAFGNNFVKTMVRLMREKSELNVVNDQVGSPTNAGNLAEAIFTMLHGSWKPGIYHFSDEGQISWYEFAVAIQEMTDSSCKVNPIPSSMYPTPARRPSFSLLDSSKIRDAFGIKIHPWKESLRHCLEELGVFAAHQ